MAVTLAAQATLYVVMRSGYRPWTMGLDWHVLHSHHPLQFYLPWLHALEHTFCGTAWALVSFSLAPGIALAVGLAASAAWWARRSARTAPLSAAAGAAAGRPARRAG